MHVSLFVVSDNMAIDARSNNVSIFTLLEEIGSPVFPILVPRVTVTAIFEREPDEPDAAFQMRAAMGDKILFETPMGADFQGRSRTRSILEIGGFAVPGPGVIEFKLVKDGVTKVFWKVQVTRVGMQQQELVFTGGAPVAGTTPPVTDTGTHAVTDTGTHAVTGAVVAGPLPTRHG